MTFATEAERQRAREAAYAFHQERCRAIHVEAYDDTFDRLYPPVMDAAEPVCAKCGGMASCWCPAPAPREAAFVEAVEALVEYLSHTSFPHGPEYDAARAEVLRIHREEVERGT